MLWKIINKSIEYINVRTDSTGLYNLKKNDYTIYILALANASVVVGVGLITPSLLIIKNDFTISAEMVQLVLTYYMVAAGIGQLISGTLSDRFGRRPILLAGGLLFSLSSLLSIFSPSIFPLLFLRVIQGLGAAACMSMARVIVTDSYEKTEAAKKLSLLTAIMVIFPLISLILGGFIAETIGWIGTMYIFVLFGFILFISALFKISETKINRLETLDLKAIYNSYLKVLQNSRFLIFTFIGAINVGVFFSSFGFMPYEFARLGVSPLEFGFWLSFTGIGYFLGNMLNRQYAAVFGIEKLIIIGTLLSVTCYLSILFIYLSGLSGPLFISIPLLIFGLGSGFTVANCIIGGVLSTGSHSGTATGIAGAMQLLSGGIIGAVIISLGGDQSFLICIVFVSCLCTLSCLVSFFNYKKY
jgi:DHA1 family bicyclomycin/chloramphenicol resistance-like MFS transporter